MAAPAAEILGSIFADPVAYADPGRWHAAARRIRVQALVLRVASGQLPLALIRPAAGHGRPAYETEDGTTFS